MDGRQTTSTQKTVDLRFDDPSFLAALVADDNVAETDTKPARPLAKVLGVERAEEFDFGALIDAGVMLVVKAGLTGDQAASQYDAAREKGEFSYAASRRHTFHKWVTKVSCEDPEMALVFAPGGLSAKAEAIQKAAFGALPAWLCNAYIARLQVHEEAAMLPPVRDPEKMAPKDTANQYSDIGSS